MNRAESKNREELQEMAKIILCEIYSKSESQNHYFSQDNFLEARKVQLLEGLCYGDKQIGSYPYHDYLSDPNIDRYKNLDSDDYYPRQSRKDFLDQRVQRRLNRTILHENFPTTESAGSYLESVDSSDNLSNRNLPEKLSDVFCRDARRYNGAFEKY